MVRKKTEAARKASVFAPAGKVLLIEQNKTSTPLKTPKRPSNLGLLHTPASSIRGSTTKKKDTSIGNTTRKQRRLKSGTKALREIRKFQKSTDLLIPKASFSRVVREILQQHPRAFDFRVSSMALMALQEATEMAMVNLLEIANLCCLHARRVTLAPSDIRLTRRAFGIGHPVND